MAQQMKEREKDPGFAPQTGQKKIYNIVAQCYNT